ncbi:MAG: pseudouridine synthase [Bacteroidia bacterium]|nr:pseudouridine synthase [Bacteroidia bacterium]
MKFRKLLQYLLVKKIRVSNAQALAILAMEGVWVNNLLTHQNIEIGIQDTIKYNNITLQKGIVLRYIMYYKPRGIECTMNEALANNLVHHLPCAQGLFHVGRLDKESEGLLLLTNDGTLHDALLRKKHSISKQYTVTVNNVLTDDFLHALKTGIVIMGQLTLPAVVTKINATTFTIVLIQGLNRQIRRMCYKHNYEVVTLLRTHFANLTLNGLQPNEYKHITRNDIVS